MPVESQRQPTAAQLASAARVCAIASTGTGSHYDVLGVSVHATASELRRAFIETVRQVHPDHNPAPRANEATTFVQEAWEVLRDPVRRAAYDRQRTRLATNDAFPFGGVHAQMRNELLDLIFESMLRDEYVFEFYWQTN